MLPNDTDFTEFREAGFAGLNFAFADGYVHYHSPRDIPANLDRASLQHHGDNLFTLTRVFGGQDLAVPRRGDATYFTLFDRVVWYPETLVVPLALLTLAAWSLLLWYARRRHGVRLRAVAGAAATVPLLLAGVGAVGVAAWWALGRLRPAYHSLVWGATYRPEWYEAGLSVLAVAVTLAWYGALRRRAEVTEVALGVWAWLVFFAVPLAFFVPGAAYLFTWPVLIGCAALVLALRSPGPTGRGGR